MSIVKERVVSKYVRVMIVHFNARMGRECCIDIDENPVWSNPHDYRILSVVEKSLVIYATKKMTVRAQEVGISS